jgi:hypothetical protein
MGVRLSVIGTIAAALATLGAGAFALLAMREAPAPAQQPIAFSHRVHALDNGIACLYCHANADRGATAGAPAVQTCYECHRAVKARNPEINKVMEHWEARDPIRWVRVYSLPQHVYFSHKRHALAEVGCESCHGAVQEMTVVSRQAPLTMGWCLDCHEQREAPRGCETCHR